MQSPLVSVIMPTYNQVSFIEEAIQSVLQQSYGNLELIIVDNYSDDGTGEFIKSLADQRIKYYQFSNEGVIAASRNYGIREAKGEYISFIDSDDIWSQDKLRLQIEALEKEEGYEISFCRFKVKSPDPVDDGHILGPKQAQLQGNIYEQLLKSNFIVSSSVVVKSSIFKDIGYFDEMPKLRCVEDYDLWLRITQKYKAVFVNEVAGTYRKHAQSASANDENLEKILYVLDKQHLNRWADRKQIDRAKANFYVHIGWDTIDKNPSLARTHFHQAVRLNFANLKVVGVGFIGIMMTFMPKVFGYIKSRSLDRKIARSVLNPQNL